MATSGFSCGKSAAEWNVLLYLWWLGVGSTPLKASLITLCAILGKTKENHEKESCSNNIINIFKYNYILLVDNFYM
jgi:hypothetical protein